MEPIVHLNAALAGRYDIEREIGAGGMATVYLARDLRHDRRVALKVLDPGLGAQLGLERFLAEIRVTANLQHPNILPLFDSGEARDPQEPNGSRHLFYVMPYVDGESLRARLTRERQLPVDDALRIALAAAHALQYAHGHGVIHRDIKPENILLQAGQPVVADFVIALAVSNAGGSRLTQTGISLGTPQYMSPEQAIGERSIDGRSDIYSLAAVLYEMLTGEPPHAGSTAQAVIARVLTEKTRSARAIRTNVPAHVDAALARALEKLPADRFTSAGEFAVALQGSGAAAAPVVSSTIEKHPFARWAAACGLVAAGAILGAIAMRTRGATSGTATRNDAPLVRASIALPADGQLALANLPPVGFNGTQITLAPDGSMLAYVAATATGNMLYVHDVATGETRALPGTEGVKVAVFSPDGAWIAFVTGTHIKKIPRGGGAAIELSAASGVYAWWPDPEFIYLVAEGGLSRVSSDGGKPEPLATPRQLGARTITDVLPGGRTALIADANASMNADHGDVLLVDVRSHRKTLLVRSAYAARYIRGGYLIFARAGSLFGVRFDVSRGAVEGNPIAIAPGVSVESAIGTMQAAAAGGMLAYVPGVDISRGKLAWIDRRGAVDFIDAPEMPYGQLDLSPDDRRIAVHMADVQDYLWIWDLARHEGQRVASSEAEGLPRWSSDGRRLIGVLMAKPRVMIHEVSQAGQVGPPTPIPDSGYAGDLSPNGEVVAVAISQGPFRTGYTALRAGASMPPSFQGNLPSFSPDGKWVAYTRAERGHPEVFVRSYAGDRDIGQVSHDGGIEPRWKPSGMLYYRNGHRWYETKVTTNPEPRWDRPRQIFDVEFIDTQGISYDMTRDAQRLLVVKRDRPMQTSRIELITNWTRLLEAKP